jgi:hypothetical protein
LKPVKVIGLTEKEVTVQGYQGYDNNYWWWKKKQENPDMKASISYWIKVSKVDMLDALVDKWMMKPHKIFLLQKHHTVKWMK